MPPKKSGNIKPAPTVLTVACVSIGNNTLPLLPLNSQVSMNVAPNTDKTKGATIGHGNSFPISGRCHSAQIGARIALAISGECFACNCGNAKPRQPGSSPSPMKSRTPTNTRSGILSLLSLRSRTILRNAAGYKGQASSTKMPPAAICRR